MKIQYLAVVFIIIIMPIIIVFSEYLNNQITTIKTENIYDARLLNSTYDSVKAYQLNTISNATSDKPESKKNDIEAAANTFLTSIANSFQYSGYNKEVINEYVPAIVFTLYDGYYIYSPFVNVNTNIDDDIVDEEYENGTVLHGLKPYVYYSCRYKVGTNSDFTIVYSLDNYITIEGVINGEYVYDYGYLLTGVEKNGDNYTYGGITFSKSTKEQMCEFLGDKLYYYVKIDGTKFYYSGNDKFDPKDDDYIFYINQYGAETKQVNSKKNNEFVFMLYYNAIFKNNTGYRYYKKAYEFTKRVLEEYGLSSLKTENAIDQTGLSSDSYEIFSWNTTTNLENKDSNFYRHKAEIIRRTVETNLATAISGFSQYSNLDQDIEFIMPKISDTDWDLIENNVCVISFMQGMPIGGKVYNGYSVVPNNLNKEHVDENDIYILQSNLTYAKANDSVLLNNNKIRDYAHDFDMYGNVSRGYYPGILNINFIRRQDLRDESNVINYYPLSYKNGADITPYRASYSSIVGSSSVNDIANIDMYRYMNGELKDNSNNNIVVLDKLKRAYYIGLGRERFCSYNVNNNLKDEFRNAKINDIKIDNAEYFADQLGLE